MLPNHPIEKVHLFKLSQALFLLIGLFGLTACQSVNQETQSEPGLSNSPATHSTDPSGTGSSSPPQEIPNSPYIVVLGIAQDAGYPQTACQKTCCLPAWDDPTLRAHPTSLGLISPQGGQKWLFEATPDLPQQLNDLNTLQEGPKGQIPDGIFLTHAHIGHYTGLVHLGREAVGAKEVPVYAMPRMATFLKENGPWSQLVTLQNISLAPLSAETPEKLSKDISVSPFLVPHRDEFSETVGYRIQGPNRTILFIPDIDKWNKWDRSLEEEVAKVDLALVDGTFFANGELPGRDMSEIPHPFVAETMDIFDNLPLTERNKVVFIHFNHTNPLLQQNSEAYQSVIKKGYGIASEGQIIPL